MILTIDVGNSSTVSVWYQGDEQLGVNRVLTEKNTPYEYYVSVFSKLNISPSDVVVGCVVPSISVDLRNAICFVFNVNPYFVSYDTVRDFECYLDNPREIGADFIATTVGAYNLYKSACIVVDVGSATKITVFNKEGSFEGGVIIPGLGISLESMIRSIPHLPMVEMNLPNSVIGKSTNHAIQSGVMNGCLMTIRGFTTAFLDEVGYPCTLVVTGGYSHAFKDALLNYHWSEYLVNEGLHTLVKHGRLVHD